MARNGSAHVVNQLSGSSASTATVGASPIAGRRPEQIAAISPQQSNEGGRRHDLPVEFVNILHYEPCSAEYSKGSGGATTDARRQLQPSMRVISRVSPPNSALRFLPQMQFCEGCKNENKQQLCPPITGLPQAGR